MKSKNICSECGSENIQAKAWVGLNNEDDIDFSASDSGDADDFWCKDCEEHQTAELRTIYEPGDEVYWKDPEGITSGTYKVIEKKTEDLFESIYLLDNGTSELEAYEHELS